MSESKKTNEPGTRLGEQALDTQKAEPQARTIPVFKDLKNGKIVWVEGKKGEWVKCKVDVLGGKVRVIDTREKKLVDFRFNNAKEWNKAINKGRILSQNPTESKPAIEPVQPDNSEVKEPLEDTKVEASPTEVVEEIKEAVVETKVEERELKVDEESTIKEWFEKELKPKLRRQRKKSTKNGKPGEDFKNLALAFKVKTPGGYVSLNEYKRDVLNNIVLGDEELLNGKDISKDKFIDTITEYMDEYWTELKNKVEHEEVNVEAPEEKEIKPIEPQTETIKPPVERTRVRRGGKRVRKVDQTIEQNKKVETKEVEEKKFEPIEPVQGVRLLHVEELLAQPAPEDKEEEFNKIKSSLQLQLAEDFETPVSEIVWLDSGKIISKQAEDLVLELEKLFMNSNAEVKPKDNETSTDAPEETVTKEDLEAKKLAEEEVEKNAEEERLKKEEERLRKAEELKQARDEARKKREEIKKKAEEEKKKRAEEKQAKKEQEKQEHEKAKADFMEKKNDLFMGVYFIIKRVYEKIPDDSSLAKDIKLPLKEKIDQIEWYNLFLKKTANRSLTTEIYNKYNARMDQVIDECQEILNKIPSKKATEPVEPVDTKTVTKVKPLDQPVDQPKPPKLPKPKSPTQEAYMLGVLNHEQATNFEIIIAGLKDKSEKLAKLKKSAQKKGVLQTNKGFSKDKIKFSKAIDEYRKSIEGASLFVDALNMDRSKVEELFDEVDMYEKDYELNYANEDYEVDDDMVVDVKDVDQNKEDKKESTKEKIERMWKEFGLIDTTKLFTMEVSSKTKGLLKEIDEFLNQKTRQAEYHAKKVLNIRNLIISSILLSGSYMVSGDTSREGKDVRKIEQELAKKIDEEKPEPVPGEEDILRPEQEPETEEPEPEPNEKIKEDVPEPEKKEPDKADYSKIYKHIDKEKFGEFLRLQKEALGELNKVDTLMTKEGARVLISAKNKLENEEIFDINYYKLEQNPGIEDVVLSYFEDGLTTEEENKLLIWWWGLTPEEVILVRNIEIEEEKDLYFVLEDDILPNEVRTGHHAIKIWYNKQNYYINSEDYRFGNNAQGKPVIYSSEGDKEGNEFSGFEIDTETGTITFYIQNKDKEKIKLNQEPIMIRPFSSG